MKNLQFQNYSAVVHAGKKYKFVPKHASRHYSATLYRRKKMKSLHEVCFKKNKQDRYAVDFVLKNSLCGA